MSSSSAKAHNEPWILANGQEQSFPNRIRSFPERGIHTSNQDLNSSGTDVDFRTLTSFRDDGTSEKPHLVSSLWRHCSTRIRAKFAEAIHKDRGLTFTSNLLESVSVSTSSFQLVSSMARCHLSSFLRRVEEVAAVQQLTRHEGSDATRRSSLLGKRERERKVVARAE